MYLNKATDPGTRSETIFTDCIDSHPLFLMVVADADVPCPVAAVVALRKLAVDVPHCTQSSIRTTSRSTERTRWTSFIILARSTTGGCAVKTQYAIQDETNLRQVPSNVASWLNCAGAGVL